MSARPFRGIFGDHRPDSEPANHGKAWDGASMTELENHFEIGLSLDEIAGAMGRTKNAISGQLERMNLVVNRGGLLFKCERMAWADNRSDCSKGREL